MARTKYWDEESRTWKYADSRKGTVNVDLTGVVKSVNGKTPDENGNVEITIPDSSQNGDFKTDKTLSMEDGVLSVNTTNAIEQDNTLPITSAGVYAAVGNIEELLKTI